MQTNKELIVNVLLDFCESAEPDANPDQVIRKSSIDYAADKILLALLPNSDTPPQLHKRDVIRWQEYLIQLMNNEGDAHAVTVETHDKGEHLRNAQAISRVLRLIEEHPPAVV